MISYYDVTRIGIRQILRQRKNYMGVILAIAFGTAGIIVLLSMGEDVKSKLNDDLELLGGATVIRVTFNEAVTVKEKLTRPEWFRDETLEALRRIPGVKAASLLIESRSWIQMEERRLIIGIKGVDGFFWTVNGHEPLLGEFFGQDAVEERKPVIVLGEKLARKIFDSTDVVGRTMSISSSMFTIVGVLGSAGGGGDLDQVSFIPLTVEEDRVRKGIRNNVYIRCTTWDDVIPVSKAVPRVVAENQSDEGLKVLVQDQPLQHVKRIYFWVTTFIYFAVAGSFLLGGYGIWNGMMSSVKARTREIGLKKAMGAEDKDILRQFMAESLCLSLVGAFLGIIMARAGLELSSRLLESAISEKLYFAVSGMTILFAFFLGFVAGAYPSIKASRMNVVDAMRFE